MFNIIRTASIAAIISMATIPMASAQGLNVLGLATITDGDASNDGLVNIGLGGGNNIVEANVLPGSNGSLVDANVSSGGGSILGVDATVGGTLNASATVGGSGGLVNVDVGIGGGGNGSGGNGGGGNGGGGNGGGGNGGGGNGGGNGGGLPGSGGGGVAGFSSTNPACQGIDPNRLIALFNQTDLRGWDRVTNIQIQSVSVCPEARRYILSQLAAQGKYGQMQSLLAMDPLISASLSRSRFGPSNVIGVSRNFSSLTLFVF